MTTTTDPQLLEELADEYAQLATDIEPKQARLDDIKKHFRALGKGTHDIGSLAVTISANRRLNTKALESAYPADEHPYLYDQKISTTKARDELGEDMIADFSTEGENKVQVKIS